MKQIYIICATQRSGSTLLCHLLSLTNKMGNPNEFLLQQRECELRRNNAEKYSSYVQRLLKQFASDNGVTGIKIMNTNFQMILSNLRKEVNDNSISDIDLINKVFYNPKFIFITRKDKLGQAISLSKAEQTGVMEKYQNLNGKQVNKKFVITPFYIKSALTRVKKRESFWLDFFQDNNITPYTIVYEDIIKNCHYAMKDCLKFLDIVITDEKIPKLNQVKLRKQSDFTTTILRIQYHIYFLLYNLLPKYLIHIIHKIN